MAFVERVKSSATRVLGELLYRSGAFLLLRSYHRRRYGPGIRILFYHRVTAARGPADLRGRRFLTAAQLSRHLKHLRRHYQVISLDRAAELLRSGGPLPENAVVITFDDGYLDNYTVAFPLLKGHRIPATLFVISSAPEGAPFWFDEAQRWIEESPARTLRLPWTHEELSLADRAQRRLALDRVMAELKSLPGAELREALENLREQLQKRAASEPAQREGLSWKELREMADSGIFSIGAHTVTHPILSNCEPEEIAEEIGQSVETIAAKLNRPVRLFAYPNGDCNAAARAAVRKLGLVACSTGGRGFNPPGTDLTALRRLGADGLAEFRLALYLAGWEDVAAVFRESIARWRRGVKRLAYGALEAAGLFALYRRLNRRRLTVLLYHGVHDRAEDAQLDNLHLPVKNFRRQMRWLRETFTPVTLEQAIAGLEGRAELPERAALVTFDDGYRNNLTVAAPILAELGIPAALFVPTGLVGAKELYWNEELEARLLATKAQSVKIPGAGGDWLWLRTAGERRRAFQSLSPVLKELPPAARERAWEGLKLQLGADGNLDALREPRLSWEELRDIRRYGVTIGSHTVSHALLPGLAPAEAAAELQDSRRELEARLGASVDALAYPNGDWSPEVRRRVAQAGYRCAFTVEPGANDRRTDRYLLRRVAINARMSQSEFIAAASDFARLGRRPPAKLLQISNYPPPQCGWAMQTKLLTEELRRRGAVCEVLNINESRAVKSPEYVDVQNGPDYLRKLVKFALRGYRFHTHVNAESKKGYLLALSANLVGLATGRPAVMTFHGGLPQTYFPRTDSRLLRMAYRLLFATAGRITCDNAQMKEAIQSYGTNGKAIVPFACFSPQYLEFQPRALATEMEEFLKSHQPVFFCYVSFRPEYALAELLEAMALFTARSPKCGFIWVGFPAKELPRAQEYLSALPCGPPANLLLLGNLDHDTFLTLLTRCSVYVRPPACDGISASVLESLALGVPVVAAENGRRPRGVVTYRFADPVDLCAKLSDVMNNYAAVKQATRLEEAENAVEEAAEWLLQQEHSASS